MKGRCTGSDEPRSLLGIRLVKKKLIAYLAEVRKKLIIERVACRWEGKPQKFRLWECMLANLNP